MLLAQIDAQRREVESRLAAVSEERDALREDAARMAVDIDTLRRKVRGLPGIACRYMSHLLLPFTLRTAFCHMGFTGVVPH